MTEQEEIATLKQTIAELQGCGLRRYHYYLIVIASPSGRMANVVMRTDLRRVTRETIRVAQETAAVDGGLTVGIHYMGEMTEDEMGVDE